jgi:hypothetical protein
MRGLRTIALGIALAGSGRFVSSSFAQAHDVDYCVTKLSTFVGEIDDLLARRPSNLLDVLAVLYGYFPAGAQGCTAEAALQPLSKSAYFKGTERQGGRRSFSFSNETMLRRGAAIQLSVSDAGNWDSPFAIWSPPFP